ncbi:MAG: hypothetical protein IH612_19235 [Desulfofustis sp.]|nr:hypothetical protein [Desulfofustis sp.]
MATILPLTVQQMAERVELLLAGRPFTPEVICFDFFDTLVSRSVPPEDTKKIAALQLADWLQNEIDGDLLYRLRQVVESRLCLQNAVLGHDPEFSIVECARVLAQIVGDILGNRRLSVQQFVELFVDVELAVEKTVQQRNRELCDILCRCRDSGVKIGLLSDFYIPRRYFDNLLSFHGLNQSIDEVFISADYLKTKGHSGRLYRQAQETFGCRAEKMVMIGDNLHADGVMAAKSGFTPLCLQSAREGIVAFRNTKPEDAFESIFQQHCAPVFPEFGLSLFWFTHRLFELAHQDRRRLLFFCSKEGEFLKKLFDRYQDIRFGRPVIASHYLYVSRKATYICSLQGARQEAFAGIFNHYRDVSPIEFLRSLNFSEKQALAICQKAGMEPHQKYANLQENQFFKDLIASQHFTDAYQDHCRMQRENFRSYLDHFGENYRENGLALVDVGWKGSIQNNIYHHFAGQVGVDGYYVGLINPSELRENNRKRGVLFSNAPAHSPYIHVFNNNRSLFEMLLGASHGSADGYFSEEQFAAAGRDAGSAFLEHDRIDYHPSVTIHDLPEERMLFQKEIKPLQQTYSALVEKLTGHYMQGYGRLPTLSWFARNHARMVFMPTGAEVDFYARLYHLENFGIFEFTTFDRQHRPTLRQRFKHLVALKKDPAAYLETGVWPPIILRRLGLDFLTPIDGKKRMRRVFREEP